jgi:hypothetical protein
VEGVEEVMQIEFEIVISVEGDGENEQYRSFEIANANDAIREFWQLKVGDIIKLKNFGSLRVNHWLVDNRFEGLDTQIREMVIFTKRIYSNPIVLVTQPTTTNGDLWPDFDFTAVEYTNKNPRRYEIYD